MKSSFGKNIKVTIFGGSHEAHIGVTIIGLPKGTTIDLDELQKFLNRRAPGNSPFSSSRKESDIPLFISGTDEINEGTTATCNRLTTDGSPLTAIIKNTDIRSNDYDNLKDIPRPGHSDFAGKAKYGLDFDVKGGGSFSGRMTAPLCIAGGIAIQLLKTFGITIGAHISSIGEIHDTNINFLDNQDDPCHLFSDSVDFQKLLSSLEISSFPVFSNEAGEKMKAAIFSAKEAGDSIGGTVSAFALGLPAGLGGSMYDGAEGRISTILFGIPAVKAVEFGAGTKASLMLGSENNDTFFFDHQSQKMADLKPQAFTSPIQGNAAPLGCATDTFSKIKTKTNNHGGILGGITTGMPLTVKVSFKPTPSIAKEQQSVNMRTGEETFISVPGRHDPCIAYRGVPVVSAALAIGILDMLQEPIPRLSQFLEIERQKIDTIDQEIVFLLKDRMELSQTIGKYKRKNSMPILQSSREEEILDKIKKQAGSSYEDSFASLFKQIMEISKDSQNNIPPATDHFCNFSYGLIGKSLPHSYSKIIHEKLGLYSYDLIELREDEVKTFIANRQYSGLNVTIPYKKTVIPFCDQVSEAAKEIGAVNTLYFRCDSPAFPWKRELIGTNTDYLGFLYMANRASISFLNKNILLLGSGATSQTVRKAVFDSGAANIYIATRQDPLALKIELENNSSLCGHAFKELITFITYDQLKNFHCPLCNLIDIIINTTPVGTYPNVDETIISLSSFPNCQGVIDVIYNPPLTSLLIEAKEKGVKYSNGLPMLVAQATAAAEYFTGRNDLQKQNEIILKSLETEKT